MVNRSSGSLVEELTCRRRTVMGALAAGATVGAFGTAAGQDEEEADDDIHPVFGLPVGPEDPDPPVEPDHEIELVTDENGLADDPAPFPARYFDPVGLAIEPGDVVEFLPGTQPQTVTAFHPTFGFEQRVPDDVGPLSSPVLAEDTSFLYRFEESGVYDLLALPYDWAGAVARLVVGDAIGPGASEISEPEYETAIPDPDEPIAPDWLAGTVLRDSSLDPDTVLANGEVRWEDLDEESKRFPLRLLAPRGPSRTLVAALGGGQTNADTNAVGSAKLTPVENGLLWHLVLEDIECVTQAHVHEGERDGEGDILAPMFEYTEDPDGTGDGDPRSTIPAEPIVQGGVITDEQAVDKILDQPAAHYVNVHTVDNPDGEIRGQLRGGHPDEIPEREPEPAEFTVSDLDQQITVTEGETFDISATITNEGDVTATQTIELRIDGDVVETQELELRCRESETVTFEITADRDPGEYEHGVFTDEDEQTGTLVIEAEEVDDEEVDDDVDDDDDEPVPGEPAEFVVSELDPEDVTVIRGSTIDVSATIENVGGEQGTQTVEYRINGETIADRELELDGGESRRLTFADIDTEPFDPGEYEHGMFTDDDEQTGTLTIDPKPPTDLFIVSDLEPQNKILAQGDTFDVSATIENVGEVEGTQTVEYRIDDEIRDEEEIELDSDQSKSVFFEDIETDDLDIDDYEHGVFTDDDEQTGELSVGDDPPLPEFTVSDLDPEELTVLQGDRFDVSATIENVGEAAGTQSVSLSIGDEIRTNRILELEPTDATTIIFAGISTADLEPGEYEFWMATPDDRETGTLTVERDGPAEFTVSDLDPEEETVTQGETFDLSATIENVGAEEGTQTAEAKINGETRNEEEIELDSGESGEVAFDDIETDDLEPGEYEHGIFTDDDEATGALTVEPDEPAEFTVSNLDPAEETVTQGETFGFSATIKNIGAEAGTQTVEALVDGELRDETEVELDSGESNEVAFDDIETDDLEPDEYEYGVFTDDDEETGTLTVEADEPAAFTVSDLDPEEVTAEPGETFDLSATIENIGAEAGTQTVEALVDGEVRGEQELELDSAESETVSFDEIETNDLDAGEYEYGIFTDDDEATGTLTVEVDEPAEFTVSDLDPQDVTVTQGETISVSATIENVGGEQDSQTVELQIDGDVRDEEEIELDGGDEETVTLDGDTADLDPDEYEHGIFTDDDEETGTLTVEDEEEADEEEEDEEEEDEEEEDEEEADEEEDEGEEEENDD